LSTSNGYIVTHSPDSLLPLTDVVSSAEYFVDCPTGTVEHYFADNTFHWSDEMFRIHGYERGEVVPSLKLGMAHIEPSDRDAAAAFWDHVSANKGAASIYASIRDLKGRAHNVLIHADTIIRDDEPVGVWGLVVDLTDSIHADRHKLANEAVAASALSRAVIEQAKGILMGRTGLNATEAFEHISQYSQRTNRKVVVISQEIIDRAHQLTRDDQHQPRTHALLDLFRAL
jgi:hypothetical protein